MPGAAPARGRLCRAVRHRLRRSSFRPPAPPRSAAGCSRRSIRSTTTRCGSRAPDRLARLGLSRPRSRRSRRSARRSRKGTIDLDAVAAMDADEAHAALTALHGIGPWTADIYLLFCLGHADAWPAGDLALQEAARIAFGLQHAAGRQGDGQARRSGGRGAGWRRICSGPTITSVKRREGAPVQPSRPRSQHQCKQATRERRHANGR